MEKPEPAQVSPAPLTILHHDEHLVFPGYDLMVGKGDKARDEESGMTSCTARNDGDEAELPAKGQSSVDVIWYKKHKRKLVIAAIIWFATFSLIPHLLPPFPPYPRYRSRH